jgi:hypothetical protein
MGDDENSALPPGVIQLDESFFESPPSYADRPWWHKPTEGERITDGFEILVAQADD